MRENSRQNTKEKKMFTDLEKRWKAIVLFLGTALLVSHANGGDDIKTFTRDHLTDLAVKSANNWYPKDKNVKLKFTLTDISSQGAMGEEHIRFKGNLVLPENCYSTLLIADELGLDRNNYEARNACMALHAQKKTLLVRETKAGATVAATGFYKRIRNPMDKKSKWEISYAELFPREPLTLVRKVKENFPDYKILKKGTPEYSQYLESLKQEYEKEKQKREELNQKTEKLQQEIARASSELRTLQDKMRPLQREYDSNSARRQTLNNRIKRETRNLNSKRAVLARNAQAKIDQANQEIKELNERNNQIKEQGIAMKKTIQEKQAALSKLQTELKTLKAQAAK